LRSSAEAGDSSRSQAVSAPRWLGMAGVCASLYLVVRLVITPPQTHPLWLLAVLGVGGVLGTVIAPHTSLRTAPGPTLVVDNRRSLVRVRPGRGWVDSRPTGPTVRSRVDRLGSLWLDGSRGGPRVGKWSWRGTGAYLITIRFWREPWDA